jgi:hypothetical protein
VPQSNCSGSRWFILEAVNCALPLHPASVSEGSAV